MSDDTSPWEKQPGEPNALFNRFHRYLTLPSKRSLLAAYNSERTEKGRKRATSTPEAWRIASKEWHWEERAAAWDAHQRSLELEKWQQRKLLLRQQEWDAAQMGIKKANEMLMLPVVRAETKGGQTVIEPGKWSFKDAFGIVVDASNLARKSTGLDEDLMAKHQLNMTYDLLKQIMLMEEGTAIADVKSLISAFLESLLLQMGKPMPEVREVLGSNAGNAKGVDIHPN